MRISFTFVLSILLSSSFAQNKKYRPIEKLGWETPELSLSWLTPSDTGKVVFVLEIAEDGRINDVGILNNTFNPDAEKRLTEQVRSFQLTRSKTRRSRRQTKGMFEIDIRRCSDGAITL